MPSYHIMMCLPYRLIPHFVHFIRFSILMQIELFPNDFILLGIVIQLGTVFAYRIDNFANSGGATREGRAVHVDSVTRQSLGPDERKKRFPNEYSLYRDGHSDRLRREYLD